MRNLIDNFGDDEGNEVNYNGTIVQALLMMNGKEINDAITANGKNTMAAALKQRDPARYLWLTALNREPTQKERSKITAELNLLRDPRTKNRNAEALWQDVFWALLNSNEFILNH
jgi:hypothetical protein